MRAGVMQRVGAMPTQIELGRLVARALNLSPFRLLISIGVTDIDVLGVRGGRIVVAEVKRRVHEGNIRRAVLQLWFRSMLADEVYIAMPYTDAAMAERIPREYGVVLFGRSTATIMRRSRRFAPAYPMRVALAAMLAGGGV